MSLALATGQAGAATKNRAEEGDWFNGLGWSPKGVPLAGDDVILEGAGATIAGAKAATRGIVVNDLLTIGKDGGLIVTNNTTIGTFLTSGGTFEISGQDAVMTTALNLNIGRAGSGEMRILEGRASVTQFVIVGGGSLEFQDQIQLNASRASNPDFVLPMAQGKLLVSGENSSLSAATLNVGTVRPFFSQGQVLGIAGSGEVGISNGGNITTVRGGAVGPFGKVSVADTGSIWNAGRTLSIQGELTVSNGGAVTALEQFGAVEIRPGSERPEGAVLTVDGDQSSLTVRNALRMLVSTDGAGAGVLTISRGGHVISRSAEIQGSQVDVSGEGSAWLIDQRLEIDNSIRSNTTTITDGGVIAAADLDLGPHGSSNTTTSSSRLLVKGDRSSLVVTNELMVGHGFGGLLLVSEGGHVTAGSGYIGEGTSGPGFSRGGGSGAVNIDGPGSSWSVSNALSIGSLGSGSLTLSNHGTTSAQVLYLGENQDGRPGTRGILNLGAAPTETATAAGSLDVADDINIGAIGAINFNHTDSAYHFSEAVESIGFGQGVINQIAGVTTLDGDLDRYTGPTHVIGGKLIVNTKLGSPVVTVESGASLGGSGNVENLVALDGATIDPGNSPGVLTIEGDFSLRSGAHLAMEITGLVAGIEHDVLDVRGDLSLDPGSILELKFLKGFAPRAGQQFSLFSVGGLFGNASAIEVYGLEEDWLFDIDFDAVGGRFILSSLSDGISATPVPVSVPVWLIGTALGSFGLMRRRLCADRHLARKLNMGAYL